jgi:hypothetical protein
MPDPEFEILFYCGGCPVPFHAEGKSRFSRAETIAYLQQGSRPQPEEYLIREFRSDDYMGSHDGAEWLADQL